MLREVADRILSRTWTVEDVQQYVGTHRNAYLTYAEDPHIRARSASGGTTSAILIQGLATKEFEGAVVCNTVVQDGKVRAHFAIATTAAQVLRARGSKYVETAFLREVLPLIRAFDGRVAVVGLPCDITALKNQCVKESELASKIRVTFALVCGHNSRAELVDEVTGRLAKKVGQPLVDYQFRVGHWRGRLEAEFANGAVVTKPSAYFTDYQNLFFFSQRKCMSCHDHYGYNADISAGDVWLFRLKNHPIKHTGLISRTEVGEELCCQAFDSGVVRASLVDVRVIMDGQSRSGPSHYNVSARHKAGKLIGFELRDNVRCPVSWHSYLNALVTIANLRLSETEWGRRLIFAVPRPILRAGLYFKKGLESAK